MGRSYEHPTWTPHFVTVPRKEAAGEQGFIGCDYLINVWVFFSIVVLMACIPGVE